MKKVVTILLLLFFLISCKTNSTLTGKYYTNSVDSIQYTFNLNNHNYTHNLGNGKLAKGKFKTIALSPEKTLIICNDMVLKKVGGFIKERNRFGDSINVGTFDGYKNAGATIFEITSKNGNLLFRKTYANLLQETQSKGDLVKQ